MNEVRIDQAELERSPQTAESKDKRPDDLREMHDLKRSARDKLELFAERRTILESATALADAKSRLNKYGDPGFEAKLTSWDKLQPIAHTYEVKTADGNNQEVTLIGTAHTYDTAKPMVQKVRQSTTEYLSTTPRDRQLVMVEGFQGGIPSFGTNFSETEYAQAVERKGELGAAVFEAQKAGAEVVSPEMPQEAKIAALKAQGFSEANIALLYVLRDLPARMRDGSLTDTLLAGTIKDKADKTAAKWLPDVSEQDQQRMAEDPAFAQTKIQEVLQQARRSINEEMQKIAGKPLFNETGGVAIDADELETYFDPSSRGKDTVIRQISQQDNLLRDRYFLDSIDKAVKSEKNPLVVLGGSHVTNINRALLVD